MLEKFFGKNNRGTDKNEPRATYRRPKIGLALGSGVAKGWAHIGVIKAMLEKGVVPDVIAGTSIGAVVGGAHVSGGMDALESWALSLSKINFFRFLDFKLRGGGLFGGQKLYDLMTKSFGGKNIEDLPIPFVAIGCELMTGHEVWMQKGDLVHAIKASFALPGVFEPVNWDGRWLVDGALVNPVPVSVCRALGAELVIAVNLAEDIYGRARAARENVIGTGTYGVFAETVTPDKISDQKRSGNFIRKLLRHEEGAPSIFANMVASLNVVQNRLSRSRMAGDPPDISITPRVGHVGLMEFHRAEELIEIGYKAFEDEFDYLRDALHIIGYRMSV
ncbi:MAG: patatin-like phospholipase family protein [Sphingomonadales bacterium]